MPRTKKVIRYVKKGIQLPEDLLIEVDLELFSDVEGKVPFAAWQKLVEPLLRQWLAERRAARRAAVEARGN